MKILLPAAFALLTPVMLSAGALAQVPSSTGAPAPTSAMPPVGGSSHTGKDTSDVANGPTSANNTPVSRTQKPGAAIPPSSNNPVVRQVRPAPSGRFNAGTSEIGNTTEGNGQLGTSGARASETMKNLHPDRR